MKQLIKKNLILTLAAASFTLTACNGGSSGLAPQSSSNTTNSTTALVTADNAKKPFDKNFIRAAYIDITARSAFLRIPNTGFQTPNVLIFGFADINASTIDSAKLTNIEKSINASNQDTVNLLSIGGQLATKNMNVNDVFNNVSSQIDDYNNKHDRKIDGVDLDLENGVSANTIKQLAQKFHDKGYIVTGAPQIYTSGGNISSSAPTNLILTSGGNTGNTYQPAISAGLFDAILVQTYNSGGFTIDGVSEDKEKFYLSAADALATISDQTECKSDTQICIPASTKVVVTTVANSGAAGNIENIFGFWPSGEKQDEILAQLQTDIKALTTTHKASQYAGVAVWSLTNDAYPIGFQNYSATPNAFTNTILNMNIGSRPSEDYIWHYPEGIGSYRMGSTVIDKNNQKYVCINSYLCEYFDRNYHTDPIDTPLYIPGTDNGKYAWKRYTDDTEAKPYKNRTSCSFEQQWDSNKTYYTTREYPAEVVIKDNIKYVLNQTGTWGTNMDPASSNVNNPWQSYGRCFPTTPEFPKVDCGNIPQWESDIEYVQNTVVQENNKVFKVQVGAVYKNTEPTKYTNGYYLDYWRIMGQCK